MTGTPDLDTAMLIERLARDARPVARLRPPLVRLGAWLLLAAVVLALIAAEHGLRPHLAERLGQPSFLAGVIAAGLTGVLAACGCLIASLPGRTRGWLLLPVPALAVWVSTISYGCLTHSVAMDGIHMGEAASCLATVLLVSIPLSLALFAMLRHVARLRPAPVSLTAGLAVAGIASMALSLFHNLDATAMILIWNLGVAALVVVADGWLGRRLLLRLDRRASDRA